MPAEWFHPADSKERRRAALLGQLGLELDTFLMMYHGVVVRNRGIETAIRALVGRDAAALVVVGDGDLGYLQQLHELASELGIRERVLFRPAVAFDVLGEYVGAADVGLVTIPAATESYYLMLPNKLFENIQAGTPVVASDFPEVRAIVSEFDIGLLVDPLDLDQINEALDKLQSDATLRRRMSLNANRAKSVLCWERERESLAKAYAELFSR
ncbi:glycosyltransferase [Citricoccus alkalitolerans]|uniref:Glycosyltransferase n=1 Tax=Citricoccus alkalitolerans TaxID=246603 RepID=A0ABV8XS87_9MICC